VIGGLRTQTTAHIQRNRLACKVQTGRRVYRHSVHEFGVIRIKAEEIIAFGRQFDPQVFHTDADAAKSTIYGGLIASGWHTACLMMRELVDQYLSKVASLGSPGVDELRWNLPVRPGDRLTLRVTITQADRSRSKPDRGIVHSFIEVLNQHRNVVMSMKAVNFLLCRLPDQPNHPSADYVLR
jgi:acyl dehydratase